MSRMMIEAGLLSRKAIKNYLGQMEFSYQNIEWKEFKSMLSSTFTIRGDANTLIKIINDIEKFNKRTNSSVDN
jgi:predicted transcriptional regulator